MSVYKKSLHAFFLKVHPDFFVRSPEQQRANEAAIGRLNELLDWARQLKAGTIRPAPTTSVDFVFFRKPDASTSAPAPAGDGGAVDLASAPRVTARFELPKGFAASANTAGLAERAVNRFLRDLLRKADCLDSTADAASKSQEDEQAAEAAEKRAVPTARHRRRRARQGPEVRTLVDAAADTMTEMAFDYQGTDPLKTPSMDFLIEQDHVLFDKTLSPVECASAVQRIQQLLPDMQYEAWYGTPLVLTPRRNDYSVGRDVPGCISIPWDFQLRDFLYFLRSQRAAIHAARDSIENDASATENLINEICRTLDSDDILITCTHAEALTALRRMRELCPTLHTAGCGGLTFEISDHYGYRQNGVLVLSKHMDNASLMKFLGRIESHLPSLRARHAEAKRLLEATEAAIEEFTRDVKPFAVDAYSMADAPGAIAAPPNATEEEKRTKFAEAPSSGVTYQHRLTWALELQKAAPLLAKYDWSDMTFALGPLRIDWDARLIVLPVNFDADALGRYVEDVQQRAAQSELDKLKNFESVRTHAEAADRAIRANIDRSQTANADERRQDADDGDTNKSPIPSGAKEEDVHRYSTFEGYSSTRAVVEENEEDDGVVDPTMFTKPYVASTGENLDAVAEAPLEAMHDTLFQDLSGAAATGTATTDDLPPLSSSDVIVASADDLFDMMGDAGIDGDSSQAFAPGAAAAAAASTISADRAAADAARRDSEAWRSEYLVSSSKLDRATRARGAPGAPFDAATTDAIRRRNRQELLSPGVERDDSDASAAATPSSSSSPIVRQRDVARGIASSSEDYGETLSVEQPLVPDMRAIHQSEQDATEHLEWEGFYQGPYTKAVPQREGDEIAEAFMNTNRWHREKAVQQMVYDLRDKYGRTSRYESGFKLGDVLGINDPKTQLRKFPKVAKGAYPGDGFGDKNKERE